MNVITFDIEEWYAYLGQGREAEYDRYLDAILDKLDERRWEGYSLRLSERFSQEGTK